MGGRRPVRGEKLGETEREANINSWQISTLVFCILFVAVTLCMARFSMFSEFSNVANIEDQAKHISKMIQKIRESTEQRAEEAVAHSPKPHVSRYCPPCTPHTTTAPIARTGDVARVARDCGDIARRHRRCARVCA